MSLKLKGYKIKSVRERLQDYKRGKITKVFLKERGKLSSLNLYFGPLFGTSLMFLESVL